MDTIQKYIPTIGLEVHVELKTETKMFCGCKNEPHGEIPNTYICPICMAHPGTLPVINKNAILKTLQLGVAVDGSLADFSEFDRKNYFYPDIPKGIQISQYKYPLVSGGMLKGVLITRVHLEEDTARSQHYAEKSIVDYNRAGVPLMELVTEPVIHSPEEASAFARELQLLLRMLGASDANMEKGEMRVEANVSVSNNSKVLGTKVEIKNLNSFKSVEKGIAFEVARQSELLKKGGIVSQETRGWDEDREITFVQRKKESSQDYRYFPEPDLPKLTLSLIPEFSKEEISKTLPVLPEQLRAELSNLGAKEQETEMLLKNPLYAVFYYMAVSSSVGPTSNRLVLNYLVSDIAGAHKVGLVKDEWFKESANATRLVELVSMFEKGSLSSRGAKEVLPFLYESDTSPRLIAEEQDLLQQSDATQLESVALSIIKNNQKAVDEYRSGKTASIQFLVGQAMRESKGAGNPTIIKDIFERLLA